MKKIYKSFLVATLLLFAWSVYYYPYEYGRWWHLLLDTPLIYEPIILEEGVDLSSKNEFEYNLEFKYYNYYDVGILFKNSAITSSLNESNHPYVFTGNIAVEIISGNEIIRRKIINRPIFYKYSDIDIRYYKAIVLDRFPLPIRGRYSDYKLKISVLGGDSILTPDKTSLYFSVSSSI